MAAPGGPFGQDDGGPRPYPAEGEVVHLVAHRLTDLSEALASVGDRDAIYPLPHGRGDEVHHGSPGLDLRSLPPKGLTTRYIHIPDLDVGTIKMKIRDFR